VNSKSTSMARAGPGRLDHSNGPRSGTDSQSVGSRPRPSATLEHSAHNSLLGISPIPQKRILIWARCVPSPVPTRFFWHHWRAQDWESGQALCADLSAQNGHPENSQDSKPCTRHRNTFQRCSDGDLKESASEHEVNGTGVDRALCGPNRPIKGNKRLENASTKARSEKP
jgi:hypothetical protein